MNAVRQLALPFRHAPHFAAEDVLRGPSNREALAWLDRTATWPFGRLALWGGAGRGKSHLLHLWAGRVGAEVHGGPLLGDPASLTGLFVPAAPLAPAPLAPAPLAIDDADAADEAALLRAINAAAEHGRPLLLAGREPPARWTVRLPDLASRLCATAAVELRAPDDATLRALLARLLSDRQLVVSDAVQDALLARLPRTAGAMREAACRLDRTALAAGGPVTRALALQVAGAMEAAEHDGLTETYHQLYDRSAQPEAAVSPDGPLLL